MIWELRTRWETIEVFALSTKLATQRKKRLAESWTPLSSNMLMENQSVAYRQLESTFDSVSFGGAPKEHMPAKKPTSEKESSGHIGRPGNGGRFGR